MYNLILWNPSKLKWLLLAACVGTILGESQAYAQCNVTGPTCTLVATGTTSSCITAFSPNRTVTNSSGSTIMVPHNSQAEWDSIVASPPTSVTFNSCTTFGAMDWADCTCVSASSCQCTTNNVTISGTGTLAFFLFVGTVHYSLNSGAFTILPATLAVSNGNTLRFRFTLPCSGDFDVDLGIYDTTLLGTEIDYVNGRNTDLCF